MLRKIIHFLESVPSVFMIVYCGALGATIYEWLVFGRREVFWILNGVIIIYFILINILKLFSPYYQWKKKMHDSNITLFEKMDIFYTKVLPEMRKIFPNKIYKFISFDDNEETNNSKISTLENNQLWHARENCLNDPYEGCNGCYNPLFRNPEMQLYGDEKILRAQWVEFIKACKQQLYLCSFTKKQTMPLWAYYAGNHKGFCIEYEITEKNTLCEVEYIACKLEVSKDIDKLLKDYYDGKLELREARTALLSLYKYMCYFKGLEWKHEAELRSVVFLSDEKRQGTNIPIKEIGLKVSAIILGEHCSEEYKKRLQEVAEKLNVKCEQAQLNYEWDYPTVMVERGERAVI